MAKHILDRLADAVEAGEGMDLTPEDAQDLLVEWCELDLTREIDKSMFWFILDAETETKH